MKLTITSAIQLSTHFKSLRRAKGWSQAELGQRLGIGQARVAQIERDPGSISVDKFLQILHLLDAKLVIDAAVNPQLPSNPLQPKKTLAGSILQSIEESNASIKQLRQHDVKGSKRTTPLKKSFASVVLDAIGKVKTEAPNRRGNNNLQGGIPRAGLYRDEKGLGASLDNSNAPRKPLKSLKPPKPLVTKKKW